MYSGIFITDKHGGYVNIRAIKRIYISTVYKDKYEVYCQLIDDGEDAVLLAVFSNKDLAQRYIEKLFSAGNILIL